jgi:hypothetical protein
MEKNRQRKEGYITFVVRERKIEREKNKDNVIAL